MRYRRRHGEGPSLEAPCSVLSQSPKWLLLWLTTTNLNPTKCLANRRVSFLARCRSAHLQQLAPPPRQYYQRDFIFASRSLSTFFPLISNVTPLTLCQQPCRESPTEFWSDSATLRSCVSCTVSTMPCTLHSSQCSDPFLLEPKIATEHDRFFCDPSWGIAFVYV